MSRDLRTYPPSRRTGRRNFRCRACGMIGWDDRPTPDLDARGQQLTVGLDQVSVEERASWFDERKEETTEEAWISALDVVSRVVGDPTDRRWYDIGTGDGRFLSLARERGFQVRGNDLFEAALEIARAEYDIKIDLGDIRTIDLDQQDVISLWCVIAHNADPYGLLEACRDALRPGGVIYLQTPRRSVVDRAAMGALRATGGRLSHWTDRRVAEHHWLLHTEDSMARALQRLGFVDVHVEPVPYYTRASGDYLTSLGLPDRVGAGLGRAADAVVERGLAPRIVLKAWARKPGELGPPPDPAP
ncbi:class I SAM-dependent methyltransferase [Nocardioides sp. SYSU DS0651]|uniref:class I SAM-dependent methyltransferase n=1 Tax=Nocardioides sp. SYSU DS0651 TaxID=3415955 RepID=UPI003F4B57F5